MERGTSGNSNLPELHNNFMSHSGWGPFCETISRIINLRTYIIYTVCYLYIIVYDTTNVYIYIIYYNIYIYTCICLYFITYMIICTFTDTVVKQISNHLDSSPPS